MVKISDIVENVRSKNAGPFWLTIDIFCGTKKKFQIICNELSTESLAKSFQVNISTIKRYEIEKLRVVKFSLPRPTTQGSNYDRDMHGAAWSSLVADLEID